MSQTWQTVIRSPSLNSFFNDFSLDKFNISEIEEAEEEEAGIPEPEFIDAENVATKEIFDMLYVYFWEKRAITLDEVEIEFPNGNFYSGEIVENKLDGIGMYKWKDRTIFKGKFERNEIQGLGMFEYPDGSKYKGTASAGYWHGKGEFSAPGCRIRGLFKNGYLDGPASMQFKELSFRGHFVKGRPARGVRVYENGIFSGQFDEFGYRKKGKFIFLNKDYYEGHWNDDQFCDFGVYYWNCNCNDRKSGEILKLHEDRFTGYWLAGKRHGVGRMDFEERTVCCAWKHGQPHGVGLIIAANGGLFVSSTMFERNVYQNSCRVIRCDESKNVVQDILRLATATPLEVGMDFQTRGDKFVNCIADLCKCTSHVQHLPCECPLFISNYTVDHIEESFFYDVCKKFPHVDELVVFDMEMKSLNQAIKDNLENIQDIYENYAILSVCTQSRSVCMMRLGLWQFYEDVFKDLPDYNAAQVMSEAEQTFHLWSDDVADPFECVYFWHFLRHFLYIVKVLFRNPFATGEALKKRSKFFGLFATMFLLVLREYDDISPPAEGNVMQMIRKYPAQAKDLFSRIVNFTKWPTIRSVYEFRMKFLTKDLPLTINEFVACASKRYPQMVSDEDDILLQTDFSITPNEFFAILMDLFAYKILKIKIEEFEKHKIENELKAAAERKFAKSPKPIKKKK